MTTDMVWGIYKKEFKNDGTFTADLSYLNHIQNPDTQFFKWKSVGSTTNGTFNQYLTGKDQTFKGVLTYNLRFSEEAQFIAGVEYENTKSIPPYANDEILGNSYKYEGANADLIDAAIEIKEDRYAGFGQLTYSPGKKVDIVIGGRYDYSSLYKGTFNPRAGLIVRPFDKTTVKVLYGTAFQAPSLFYQYEQFGIPPFAFRSTNEIITQEDPDWKLKNQKLKTLEMSVTQKLGKMVQVNLSVYHNKLEDLIERVMYDTTGSTWNKYFNKYTNGQRNENIGVQKITGTNLTVNAVLSPTVNGYFYHSYTDARAEKSSAEVPIARVAEQKVWIGAVFKNVFGFVTVSPRFKWVGDINAAASNPEFSDGIQPGYTSFDISVSAKDLI
ncbi:MAG: TonB-dependent receptor, partial [bacterium]|nr:TonB-dependent receptor [bacterium]